LPGLTCANGHCTGYAVSTVNTAFIDACAVSGVTPVLTNTDDGTAALTIPFPFQFYAYNGTSAWVSSNGVVGIGSTATTSLSGTCPLPTSATSGYPYNAIFAFWEDLRTSASGICAATVGTAPNREYVITWSDTQLFADSTAHLTFEVILYEGSNLVDIVYSRISTTATYANGVMAISGMQNIDATSATSFSCHQPMIMAPLAIRFTPM
jgi:hypothetical protein